MSQINRLFSYYCNHVVINITSFIFQSFSELKFRYVEESQPEEFFIPYVWTLIQKKSELYIDPSLFKISSAQ